MCAEKREGRCVIRVAFKLMRMSVVESKGCHIAVNFVNFVLPVPTICVER